MWVWFEYCLDIERFLDGPMRAPGYSPVLLDDPWLFFGSSDISRECRRRVSEPYPDPHEPSDPRSQPPYSFACSSNNCLGSFAGLAAQSCLYIVCEYQYMCSIINRSNICYDHEHWCSPGWRPVNMSCMSLSVPVFPKLLCAFRVAF
jgi:hypothetical protein